MTTPYRPTQKVIQEIREDLFACASCGYCRFGCPVFQTAGFERVTPRGRILALKRAIDGRTDVPAEIVDSIYRCLQCAGCKVNCPMEIDFVKICEAIRGDMAEKNILPEGQEMLRKTVSEKGNPFGEPAAERGVWAGKVERLTPGVPLLYFAGCASSYASNRIARSVVKVLETAGIPFNVMGREENCCAAPLLRVGDEAKAKVLIDKNIAVFERLQTTEIVASCAGCFKTLKTAYPEKFHAMHVTQFFLKLLKEGAFTFKKDFPKKIIYFDGCDIGRHAGVYEEPREFLRAIPGVTLLEYDYNREKAICCGGPLLSLDIKLAAKIAADRVREAAAKGAEMIATPCPTCMVNLKSGAEEAGIQISIQDIPMILPGIIEKKTPAAP
ncbi:MAG: (Fe-S)-binding protein [Planctomycetota bacterium]